MSGYVHAVDRDGSVNRLAVDETMTLMEVLRGAGLSVEARCGGAAKCATCHVYVGDPWFEELRPATDFETGTLCRRGVDVRANSRLACQIKWTPELEGIQLTVAPGKDRKLR